MSPRPTKVFRLNARPAIEIKLTHGFWKASVDVFEDGWVSSDGWPRVWEHNEASHEMAEAKFAEVCARWRAKYPDVDVQEYLIEYEWRWTRHKERRAV